MRMQKCLVADLLKIKSFKYADFPKYDRAKKKHIYLKFFSFISHISVIDTYHNSEVL